MADWPEFTITDDAGATSDWTPEGDIGRYIPGIAARVRWVELRARLGGVFASIDLPESHRLAIQIDLEPSAERASGIAAGPGGAGWKMTGGPGTVVFYVQCPTTNSTDKSLKALAPLGKVHQWAGYGGATWLRVAGASATAVWDTVDGSDAIFDGYEIVREHGPPEVSGQVSPSPAGCER